MKTIQSYQKKLFQQVQETANPTISKAIESAYFATPRHLFVDRILDRGRALVDS